MRGKMDAMTDEELKRLFDEIREDSAAARGESAAAREESAAARAENAAAREESAAARAENAAAHAETRRQVGDLHQEIAEVRREAGETAIQTRHYFDVAVEAFRDQVQLVAEKVVALGEELHRETADIRLEMRTGFAETQAMIKFSHDDLDRRVRALEEKETLGRRNDR
jgi:uncharacterized protein (DUF3084 family)